MELGARQFQKLPYRCPRNCASKCKWQAHGKEPAKKLNLQIVMPQMRVIADVVVYSDRCQYWHYKTTRNCP